MGRVFIDDQGGAFASIAAAFAGDGAVAASTNVGAGVPAEIDAALGEIGLTRPAVIDAKKVKGERTDVSAWGHRLHAGEGQLEKLALARIARDRIERRVAALLAK